MRGVQLRTRPEEAPRSRGRVQGFSSLEVVISVLLFMSLFAAMGTSASSVNLQLRESNVTTQTEELARTALERIVRELRESAPGTAIPAQPEPSSSITYQVVEGWNAGAAVLSSPRTLALVGGDLQLDGVLLLADLETVEFSRAGKLLTIRVTAQKMLDGTATISKEWVAHVAN